MAKTQSAVEEAQQALAELSKRRKAVVARKTSAEERRANAGDNVDELVLTAQEIDACETAIKHLDGQSAGVRAQLAAAEREEMQEEVRLLEAQLDAFFGGLVQDAKELYERAVDPSMDEVARRYVNLLGKLATGPIMHPARKRSLEQLQSDIEKVVVRSEYYKVVEHGNPRRLEFRER